MEVGLWDLDPDLQSPKAKFPLAHAVALGLVQGPTELMPVSSSGHIVVLPALAGSPYSELDPELRKSFEVALHAGTAAALLIALRSEVAEELRGLDPARLARIGVTLLPVAIVGLAFERRIEEGAGSPRLAALAQVVAGLVLAAADRSPARRRRRSARLADAFAIGCAQAAALVPGVSRNGATLSAARALGFRRGDASRLSRQAALPVIAGATALKSTRLAAGGLPPELRGRFALGAAAAFASTLSSARLIGVVDRAGSYTPWALYRVGFGLLALAHLARRSSPASG